MVDVLFTGIGVLCLLKVAVLGNIFKLNRWRKEEENEQSCHWHRLNYVFSTGKCKHVHDSDSSRRWTESSESFVVVNGKIPHHIFILSLVYLETLFERRRMDRVCRYSKIALSHFTLWRVMKRPVQRIL